MGPEQYEVSVVHYINPHLIWVLVKKEGDDNNIFFEQIGIYGILPQNIQFEIDCVVKTERCEQWVPAAVFVMKKIFLEAAEVWFSPTYIDEKVSIFDNNTHKYGDLTIILKNGKQVSLCNEMVDSGFAYGDECFFHEQLREGKLETKLNCVSTLNVMHHIEEGYKTRHIPKRIWQNALEKQTSILQEKKHLETTLTARKLDIHDRNNVETLLKNKLNDLKLCKDIDEDSAGRASVRSSRPSSVLSVALKKKLDLLQTQKNENGVIRPVTKPSAFECLPDEIKNKKDVPNGENVELNNKKSLNKYESAAKEDFSFNMNKRGKHTRKPKTLHKNDANLVAFGPAGLQASKFSIKAQGMEEQEPIVKQKIIEKNVTEAVEDKQERDVYAKTDSEVNIKITNSEILNKLRSQNVILDNIVANKSNNSIIKGDKMIAMKRKIRYLEDKICKINDSLSSTSDIDSSKHDLDSDSESITALEEKLGLQYNSVKKGVTKEHLSETVVNQVKNDVNPFKNLDGSISIFVDKLVTPVLMVHTKKDNRIQPVSNMRDIPFGTDIHRVLKNMSILKPMRPQTVSWPTILRGHSFFMIGPHDSGNTMGYLPAVCRLVSDFKNTADHCGLSCVIVCATALAVTAVESVCKMFLHNAKIFACYAGIPDLTITTSLLNGCDLLICTPTMLVRLIQEDFSLDFRNLSTLVIDDCERISKVYRNELKFCLLKVRDIVKVRANKELKVQYIVVSRLWCDFMLSLARKAPDSVVCVSAFEECVLYSKAMTSVEFVIKENKLDTVINFLKGIDRSKKTVIVCREDEEVKLLEKALSRLKYVVFACDSTMTVHDLYNLDKTLKDYEEPVLGPVLVCCDGNLTHLNVTDANYLVHYSLPALFSMFCKRFAVLIDNYPSVFKREECKVKIKILLDDNNIEQLPKILHFIKRCTNDIPTALDELSMSVLAQKDLKKAQELVPICNKLLTLGRCPDYWHCIERHAVFKEYDDPKPWLPKEGVITFQMLHYHSAVYYSVRLTSCVYKSQITKYPQSYSLLSLKMGMYYSKEVNRKLHGVPKVGDLCAVTLKQNLFVRCQVMKILRSTNNQPSLVLIKLIDEEKLETAHDTWLYHLPDELKSIETHVTKVILSNIMPQDKDVTYSKLAKHHLKKITDENDDLYLRGHITLVVGNCIFVDTLEACQDLSSLEEVVVKYDFRKELLDGHALPNPDHIGSLKKLCGISDNISEEVQIQVQDIPKFVKILPKERWAHLESSGFSSVFFMSADSPWQFFVRPIKFDKCLTILIKDIQKYVATNPDPVENVNVGDIVLAEFPDDATYERARIDDITDNNKVKCFFVDQADWRYVSVKKLLTITERFITVLPFQAIECRLVGIKPVGDDWTDFSTNFLADNCYDSGDKLKQLYAKCFTKQQAKITGGHKYGVALIDTYSEEDIVINQIMIIKNLADENDEVEYLNDIQFKRESSTQSDSDADEWDEKKLLNPVFKDKNENSQQYENTLPSNSLLRSVPLVDSDESSDEFDFVTDNSGQIGSIPISKVVSIKEIPDTQTKEIVKIPVSKDISVQPSDDNLMVNAPSMHLSNENKITKSKLSNKSEQESKPKLLWRQNSNTVTVQIKLILDDYDVTIKERYLKFSAKTNGTKYGFEFELYGVVDLNKSSHANKGQYIQIKLWKLMARNWLTLTRSSGINKWIVYDLESIDVSSDEDSNDKILNAKNFIDNMDESDSDDNFQDDISFAYKRE